MCVFFVCEEGEREGERDREGVRERDREGVRVRERERDREGEREREREIGKVKDCSLRAHEQRTEIVNRATERHNKK